MHAQWLAQCHKQREGTRLGAQRAEFDEHTVIGQRFAYCGPPTTLDWQFTDAHGQEHAVRVRSRFSINNGAGLRMAALEGLGIILQPVERVQEDPASGKLVQLLADYAAPSRPIHLRYAPDRRPTPKLRSFVDHVIAAFGR